MYNGLTTDEAESICNFIDTAAAFGKVDYYITPTGAVISVDDYPFLPTHQQEQCSSVTFSYSHKLF